MENFQIFWSLFLVFASSSMFDNCGVSAIQGGNFDYENKFNYQVSIQKKKSTGQYEHGCGGSIIGKKRILTAAHCFISRKGQVLDLNNDTMRILAGTSNLNKGGIIGYIEQVFIPKSYRHENHLAIDDIAVVQLRNSLFAGLKQQQQRGNLSIIHPLEKFDYSKLKDQTAVVSGFGITERNATTPSFTRKYLAVKITKKQDCTELGKIVCVTSLSLLGAQGFCYGDSGGPLVFNGKLLGVISRGVKVDCDMTTKAGKFMLVPHYLDFIRKAKRGSLHDHHGIVILPDMAKEAENIFKPTTFSSAVQ